MHRGTSFALLLVLAACGYVPEVVSWSDPRLLGLKAAIDAQDRASLGFTPIDPKSEFRLEDSSKYGYDAMLHICGLTKRTIAFRSTPTGYEWIHEQETHQGPLKSDTPDGTFNETITLTYETAPISGVQVGVLNIRYIGPREGMIANNSLTYADVSDLIAKWHETEQVCAT